jgi:site-specific DNA recombinase
MTTAVIYTRVSTTEQADSGAGLQAQEDAARRFAAAQGWTVAGVFTDAGVSGAAGLEKRPALLEAISTLERGGVLVVAKLDRVSRGEPLAAAMIEAAVTRKGARIVSAAGEGTGSDDPTAILMKRMVMAFAEYERLIIGARTKAALQAKSRRGERCGQIPYGYILAADGVTLEPVAAELAVIEKLQAMRAAGHTLRAIADELTRQGFLTREGKPAWTHTTVASILRRSA